MAMFPRRDRSTYYNSLRSNSQEAQNLAAAKIAYTDAKNDTTLLRKKMQEAEEDFQIDMEATKNVIGGLTNFIYAGVSGDFSPIVGEKINSLIQNSQIEKGNAALLPMITEGDGIAKKSLVDGSSYFDQIETENGLQTVFVPSQSLKDWYDESIAAIDEMQLLPNVKSQLKAKIASNYYGQVQSLQASAIEQAYADLQSSYATNLEASLVSDASLWAEYGGKLPEGVRYSGIAVIAGRSDFSDERKQTEIINYMNSVRYLGVQDKAVQIARSSSGGMADVDKYLQEQSFLKPQERNSIYTMAQTSYNQMKDAYTTEAENLMTEAFMDMGSTPYQIEQEIIGIARSNNLPADVLDSMLDSFRRVQSEGLDAMVSNQLAMDSADGYSAYSKTLEYLKSGGADSWFYGLPDKKAYAISQYETTIETIETSIAESLGTEAETIKNMDKDLLSGYQTGLDNDWNLFESGSITGEQYMQQVTDRTLSVRKEAQLPETTESIIAAQSVAMDKVMGYIPSAYRSDIESIVENLLIAEGQIASQKSKRTPEEWAKLNKAITATNGAIADAIYQYGVKVISSPEDIFNFANKTSQAFILENEVLGSDGMSDIPLPTDPGVTMKDVITSAVETNNTIVDSGESNYVYLDTAVGYDPLAVSDEEGNITGLIPRYLASGEIQAFPEYRFISVQAQEDYNRRADVFRSQLAMAMGVDESRIMDNPEASAAGNTAIASPIMFADGRVFRVRGYTIQETKDGKTWLPYAQINKDGIPTLINSESEPQTSDGNGGERRIITISADNIRDFIKPTYEITARGRQLTGVVIDPAIKDAKNYTKRDVINLVKDTPELQQIWQMVATQLNDFDKEDN